MKKRNRKFNYINPYNIIYCIGDRENRVTKEEVLKMLQHSEKQKEVSRPR